ncbi:hypothetical protein [Nocardia brasiliensis]|uniref:hypothetical protein n=1 Tax=Nocardia brasiliensis TaxID=37326 RepID=UPI00114D2EFD|nr:hypothetical protein [Nocardia brasiliensis]
MRSFEPVDALAEPLRHASHGADPRLAGDLVVAASGGRPSAELAVIAEAALASGIDLGEVIRACAAARLRIRTRAGAVQNYDDPAEDYVLDLLDRLTGWCGPGGALSGGPAVGE